METPITFWLEKDHDTVALAGILGDLTRAQFKISSEPRAILEAIRQAGNGQINVILDPTESWIEIYGTFSGDDLARRILRDHPQAKVYARVGHPDEVGEGMQYAGYLPTTNILEVIESIVDGSLGDIDLFAVNRERGIVADYRNGTHSSTFSKWFSPNLSTN